MIPGGRLREAAPLAYRLHVAGRSRGRRAVLLPLKFQPDKVILAPADRVAVHPLSLAAVIGAHPDDLGSPVARVFGEQGSDPSTTRSPAFGSRSSGAPSPQS